MSGSVTVLDNTADGTAALTGNVAVSPTGPKAYSFTTDGSSTWEISGIRLGLSAPSAGSYSVNIGLYAGASNLPTGSALASVSLSFSLTTTRTYFSLDAATLGAVANYSMAAGTSYALVLSNPTTGTTVRWSTIGTSPTAYAGFTFGSNGYSGDGGASWLTAPYTPALQMLAEATCFLGGTLILTARGEVPVERLRTGDLVVAKFGGLRPIRWVGTQRFEGRLAGKGQQPIRFMPGSLGDGVPSCDLWVSPGHAMLVGEVLAHAGALLNGVTITQGRVRGEIEYFHLDLGPHDCVLANGAWAESYFEDRNRDSFHNAAEFHALNPGHVAERQATCLPIVTAGHPAVEGLRRRLAPRAMRDAA